MTQAYAASPIPFTIPAMTIEMNESIARILLTTDLLTRMRSRWHFDDGSPDWEQVRADIHEGLIDGWSSGEQRMARAALAMHDIDLWAVDTHIKVVIAAGLRRTADELDAQAAETRAWFASRGVAL